MAPQYLKSTPPRPQDEERLLAVRGTVTQVIADVRDRGDSAVREYSENFDGWSPPSFRLDSEGIDRIIGGVPEQVIDDIKTVQRRVRVFAQHQFESLSDFEVETEPGVFLGQKSIPVRASGAYVPGGRYPLVASAHMTVVTAKVAGVEHVTACTPPIHGEIPAATIAASTWPAPTKYFYSAEHRPSPRWHWVPKPSARSTCWPDPGTPTWPKRRGDRSARSESICSPDPPRH